MSRFEYSSYQLKAYCLSFIARTNSNNIIFSRLLKLDGLCTNATSKPNNRIFIVICLKWLKFTAQHSHSASRKSRWRVTTIAAKKCIWLEHISWLNVVGRNHSVSRIMLKEYKWKSNNNSYNFMSCIYCRWYVSSWMLYSISYALLFLSFVLKICFRLAAWFMR